MADQGLRELLEQLHAEIERTDTIDDEKGQELLRHLGSDIRELLDRSEGKQIKLRPKTVQSLEDTIDYLEISHPALTTLLAKVLETLSSAGV